MNAVSPSQVVASSWVFEVPLHSSAQVCRGTVTILTGDDVHVESNIF